MPGGQPNNQAKQLQDAKSKKDANKETWAKNRQGDGTSKDREKAPGIKHQGMFRQEILEEGQRRQNDS